MRVSLALLTTVTTASLVTSTIADEAVSGAQQKQEQKKNRGKIQAQGGDIDDTNDPKTVSWNQDDPITVDEALKLLQELESKLSKKQRKEREEYFKEAKEHIQRAGKAGGDNSHIKRTFPRKRKDKTDIRVDIDIFAGTAFVPSKVVDTP